MKLLSIRYEYNNTPANRQRYESIVREHIPGIELTVEKEWGNDISYRADSDDPLDFFKMGMITAYDIEVERQYDRHMSIGLNDCET